MKSASVYKLFSLRLLLSACFSLVGFAVFAQQSLSTNLYVVGADGSKTLMDGNITMYDDIFCNCVNWQDGLKMTNPGENWGLLRSNTTLAVERRKLIAETDTTYIRMWNMHQLNFTMEVVGSNLAQKDLVGYVRDNYTKINTPLNLSDTTYVNFSVNNNSGTSAQNRFSIIFEKKVPIPASVKFTNIKLIRKDARINVEFAVDDENVVKNYTMQHARDTANFNDVKSITPKNMGGSEVYNEDGGKCNEGENYYRIKATDATGKIIYSSVAKLLVPKIVQNMNVYPNPTYSKQLQLQTASGQVGKYQVRIINVNGIVYPLGSILLTGDQNIQSITLPTNMQRGFYRIQLIGADNSIIVKSFMFL